LIASKTTTKMRILDFDLPFDEHIRKTKVSQKSPRNVWVWHLVQKPCGHGSLRRYKKWIESKTLNEILYIS
jgi:hypothetical protein